MSIIQNAVLIYGIRIKDIPKTEENKEILEQLNKDIEDRCIDVVVLSGYDNFDDLRVVGVKLEECTISEEELIAEISSMKTLVPHYLKELPLQFHLCMDVF